MQVRELPLGRIAAAVAALVVVVAIAVAAVVWPLLRRVDRTLSPIETSLPIPQTIPPEVPDIGDDVDRVVPAVQPVGPGLERLDGRIRDLNDLRLEARILDRQDSLPAIDTLPGLRTDLSAGLADLGAPIRETEQHAENLDRRTGPPPPELRARRR